MRISGYILALSGEGFGGCYSYLGLIKGLAACEFARGLTLRLLGAELFVTALAAFGDFSKLCFAGVKIATFGYIDEFGGF